MIRGVALVLICAALALVPYFYRLELQARIEPGPQADAQVLPSPAETPGSGSERPGPVEGLQLDAPGPEDPPGGSLEVVDGDDLFALVTKQTTLGQYKPHDLEVIPEKMIHPDQRQWPYLLRREPLEQLTKMWEAAEADGGTADGNLGLSRLCHAGAPFQRVCCRVRRGRGQHLQRPPGAIGTSTGDNAGF